MPSCGHAGIISLLALSWDTHRLRPCPRSQSNPIATLKYGKPQWSIIFCCRGSVLCWSGTRCSCTGINFCCGHEILYYILLYQHPNLLHRHQTVSHRHHIVPALYSGARAAHFVAQEPYSIAKAPYSPHSMLYRQPSLLHMRDRLHLARLAGVAKVEGTAKLSGDGGSSGGSNSNSTDCWAACSATLGSTVGPKGHFCMLLGVVG